MLALEAGADGITLHLREDRRHIGEDDLRRLAATIKAPINLEMVATEEMVAIALAARPHAVCLVPERREEVTTEGGLDAADHRRTLEPVIARLNDAGIRVSLFIDPDEIQVRAAAELKAPVVELHTRSYADRLRRLGGAVFLINLIAERVNAVIRTVATPLLTQLDLPAVPTTFHSLRTWRLRLVRRRSCCPCCSCSVWRRDLPQTGFSSRRW